MTRPILAFHIILSTYGFWLPNDPRGSWSQFVAAWELLKFGKATKVTTHRSVAGCPHDREKRRAAKKVLKYPVIRFTGRHARAAATGFARACAEGNYTTLACSIMPDHAHLVVAYTPRPVEQVVAHLKGRASQQLKKDGLQPVGPVWTEGSWEVFLFDREDLLRAVDYTNDNPEKHGMRKQTWKFVRTSAVPRPPARRASPSAK